MKLVPKPHIADRMELQRADGAFVAKVNAMNRGEEPMAEIEVPEGFYDRNPQEKPNHIAKFDLIETPKPEPEPFAGEKE